MDRERAEHMIRLLLDGHAGVEGLELVTGVLLLAGLLSTSENNRGAEKEDGKGAGTDGHAEGKVHRDVRYAEQFL